MVRHFISFFIILFFVTPVSAQIVTNNTTLNNVQGKYSIDAALGRQVGSTLLHSFEKFNLKANESAIFTGSETVQTLINRVTGGESSVLEGTLTSELPNADFYFINPAGIIIAPTAQINVPKALYLTTASYIDLQDGGRISATAATDTVLTSAPPSAFGFLGTPAPVTLGSENAISRSLTLKTGQTLAIIAGDVSLNNSQIAIKQGTVNIISVAKPMTINLETPASEVINSENYGKVTIQGSYQESIFDENRAIAIDVSGNGGGRIAIQAGTLNIDKAFLFADTQGAGQGQGVELTAKQISLQNGSRVTAETARNTTGNAGDIQINAQQVSLRNASQLDSRSIGRGNAGNITINASDSVELIGELEDTRSAIIAETRAQGKGGNIQVNTRTLSMNEGEIRSNATSGSSGVSGDINVTAETIDMQAGSFIESTARNYSQGGNITIKASQWLHIAGKNAKASPILYSGIRANTQGLGKAGAIEIETPELVMADSANIEAGTAGIGAAGYISLKVGRLNLTGKETRINTSTLGRVNGGNIAISAQSVNLSDNSLIKAESTGTGSAGQIDLTVTDKCILTQNAQIITEASYGGDGGNITFKSDNYLFLVDSQISASVTAKDGNGGNVNLNPDFVLLKNGKITAFAEGKGNGGNIQINTKSLFTFSPTESSRINASSRYGLDGEVAINTPDIDLSGSLALLEAEYLSASDQLSTQCNAQVAENISRFVILGREGFSNSTGGDLLH